MGKLINMIRSWYRSGRSVSPVVGTILMVAVVIIIASVIGSAALGFGDELGSTEVASDQCGVSNEFDPSDVSEFGEHNTVDLSCQLWFDATAGDYSEGDDVSTWSDQSGNGYSAEVHSGDPTWSANVEGTGVPGIEFDQSNNEKFRIDAKPADINIVGEEYEYTIITLVKPVDEDGRKGIHTIGDNTNNNVNLRKNGPTDNWWGQGMSTAPGTEGNWTVLTQTYDGSTAAGYANGNLLKEQGPPGEVRNGVIWLGYSSHWKNYHWDGAITEFIIFDRTLNGDERRLIECHLDEKYGDEVTVDHC